MFLKILVVWTFHEPCSPWKTVVLKRCAVLSRFSHVWFFVTLRATARQTPQARILEQVAMSSTRGSSQPRDQTCVLCLLHCQVGSLPGMPPGKPKCLFIWLLWVLVEAHRIFFVAGVACRLLSSCGVGLVAPQLVGSQSPDQVLNLSPLYCKADS